MKLSIQSANIFKILGADAGMKAIKEAGFDALDCAIDGFYSWDEICSGQLTPFYSDDAVCYAYMDELIAAAKKHGVKFGQFHGPFPTYMCDEGRDNDLINKNLRIATMKAIELCAYAECDKIIVHPCFKGSARYPITKEQEYEANISFFSSLIPILKEKHVTCCLENMWTQNWATKKIYYGICTDPKEACMYIDTLNGLAGETLFAFCLDIGHLTLLGYDPCYALETLGDRVVALHVHDNYGVTDDHSVPYCGVTDWNRFILGMKKINFKGYFNFETGGIQKAFPPEMATDVMKFIAATGRYLVGKIEQ